MLRAKNMVVSGDYLNGTIRDALGTLYITEPLVFGVVEVSRKTVIAIEDPERTRKKADLPQSNKEPDRDAAEKAVRGFHQVGIHFRNGKHSLVKVDEDIYRKLHKNFIIW